jgi:hypothetical protein
MDVKLVYFRPAYDPREAVDNGGTKYTSQGTAEYWRCDKQRLYRITVEDVTPDAREKS